MGTGESGITRLLAGEMPANDPELGRVSAFLAGFRESCPPVPVDEFEGVHLALVAREAENLAGTKSVRRSPAQAGRRNRSTLVTALAAAVGLLVTGAGVASAVGGIPLDALVPGVRIGFPVSLRQEGRLGSTATSSPLDRTSTSRPVSPSAIPATSPATMPAATGSPTPTAPGKSGTAKDKPKTTNGKSGAAKDKPKTNNGKSGAAKDKPKATNGKSGSNKSK